MSTILDLKWPIPRDEQRRGREKANTLYVTGQNCMRIEQSGVGWRIVVDAHYSYWVPPDWVACVEERSENYNKGEVPSYAEPAGEDTLRCKLCGFGPTKLHALKIHYGKSHGESR